MLNDPVPNFISRVSRRPPIERPARQLTGAELRALANAEVEEREVARESRYSELPVSCRNRERRHMRSQKFLDRILGTEPVSKLAIQAVNIARVVASQLRDERRRRAK